jgi:hypothetical protein
MLIGSRTYVAYCIFIREVITRLPFIFALGPCMIYAAILRVIICPPCCRNLSTAMIEREDFASGTSSKSTKLVHGGVRYLEKVKACINVCSPT